MLLVVFFVMVVLGSTTLDFVVALNAATDDLVGVFGATTVGFVADFTTGPFFNGLRLKTASGRLRAAVALLVRGVTGVGVEAVIDLDNNLDAFGVVVVTDLGVNVTLGDTGTATDFKALDGVETATDLADCLGVVVGVVAGMDLDDNLDTFGGVAEERSVFFLINGDNGMAVFSAFSRLLFLTGDATDGDEDEEVMER